MTAALQPRAVASAAVAETEQQLMWRGHPVVTLTQAAALCQLQRSTLTGLQARPGTAGPPPPPITYLSDDWGPRPLEAVLTHPETGELLYDRAAFEQWDAHRRSRPGMAWRRGQRGPAGRWYDDMREGTSGTAGCRSA
jgi:hypothetical protein